MESRLEFRFGIDLVEAALAQRIKIYMPVHTLKGMLCSFHGHY